jgi:predicted O-methyltransferase YrrM
LRRSNRAKHGQVRGKPKRKPLLTEAEAAGWYAGKSFSFDWTSWHFPNWIKLLSRYRGRSLKVLEIGSWEGRSALFFLNFFPRSRLTCIDSFEGGKEHQVGVDPAAFLRQVERRFDANVAAFARRVEKIKARSADALVQLGVAGRRFDIAYIDGSHLAADVYGDATLTWPLLAHGGILIFDDYLWDEMPEPLDRPKPGIDAFLKAIEGQYRTALDDYQVAIIKR